MRPLHVATCCGLLELAEALGNVSQACRTLGYSRESFYTYKELYEKGGEIALRDISRKKPCHKNRVEESIEKAVVDFALDKPAFGQLRVSNEFKKQGIYNLYRIELSHFWRMLYTLEGNKIEVFAFVLSITDHPTYDALFGYRKR